MTIVNSIQQAQSLIQQLAHSLDNDSDKDLLKSLSIELHKIDLAAQTLLNTQIADTSSGTPEIKSGCYVFPGQKEFFCPHCYDNAGDKIPTKRMNSKLRICSRCRSSIKLT